MTAKLNQELELLLSLDVAQYRTIDRLRSLGEFVSKYLTFDHIQVSTTAKHQLHTKFVLNQYLINEFYSNLPTLLSLLFPSDPSTNTT